MKNIRDSPLGESFLVLLYIALKYKLIYNYFCRVLKAGNDKLIMYILGGKLW